MMYVIAIERERMKRGDKVSFHYIEEVCETINVIDILWLMSSEGLLMRIENRLLEGLGRTVWYTEVR